MTTIFVDGKVQEIDVLNTEQVFNLIESKRMTYAQFREWKDSIMEAGINIGEQNVVDENAGWE